MPRITAAYLLKVSTIYMGAVVAGWAFSRLHVPLPWMIGPLLLVATCSVGGLDMTVPFWTRHIGQVVVAGSVGLNFTWAALLVLVDHADFMLAAAVMTLLAGFLTAAMMRRLTRTDSITCTLCCVPLGPMESAHLAEQYGVPPGPVAFVQTLRIALTVTLIPPLLVWLDPRHLDLTAGLSAPNWTLAGTALTLAFAAAGAFIFRALRISNPMFLGALAGTALAMLLALPVSPLPYAVIAGGQVLLGVWLGACFNRELMQKARSFIPASMLATVLLLSSCALVGTIIAWVGGLRWDAMVLATAPGSVTEMALTAKILAADPAMVTAFHVVRIFLLIPFAPLIFRIVGKLAKWGA
jgi:membrane AbrB-like protein